MNEKRNVKTVEGIEHHPTGTWGGANRIEVDGSLLPCPFCGHEAGYRYNGREYRFPVRAECSNTSCGVATPSQYQTKELAAEAWNRRTSSGGEAPKAR